MKPDFSLKHLIFYFLKLGTIGFGGSIALAHYMHTDLVEKRKWISESEYKQGLTLSQLAPGPLSPQLAIYIGYIKKGILGATAAGIAFILPSFLMVLGISVAYIRFGNLSWMQHALYGIGAAVIGIIIASAYTLTKKTMKKKLLLWLIYVGLFILVAAFKQTNVIFFILSGFLTMFFYTNKKINFSAVVSGGGHKSLLLMLPLASLGVLGKLFIFFLEAGSLAFGGGLAIIPFLQSGVVHQNHWLTNRQFTDAVAVAMITPGPVVITSAFIGYLVAQVPGAIVATIAIFLPIYLIVIIFTPFFNKHAKHPHMVAFVEGVTAAAMGAIAGSIILLGQTSISDIFTMLIALMALISLTKFKIPGVIIIIFAGILGAVYPYVRF